jgi:hypothetical protein
MRSAGVGAVVHHHGHCAWRGVRRVARVVVLDAGQDGLVGGRAGRARDREHPRGRVVAHGQACGCDCRRGVERQRLNRIAVGTRRQRGRQRGQVGRIDVEDRRRRRDQHGGLLGEVGGVVGARGGAVEVGDRGVVDCRHGNRIRCLRGGRYDCLVVICRHGQRAAGGRVAGVVVLKALQNRGPHRVGNGGSTPLERPDTAAAVHQRDARCRCGRLGSGIQRQGVVRLKAGNRDAIAACGG